ncbi:MAG: energy transducer TonB [Bacteroidales bacterium]|nr:energy transducer TonB [Bacteroidales bacterium]
MEAKKSKKADLEWRKPLFLEIGLLVALVVVLLAFEYIGTREKVEVFSAGIVATIEEEQIIQTEQQKDLLPPPPPEKSQTLLEIVDDDIAVEDIIIDSEADENMQVEEREYVEVSDTKEAEPEEEEVFVIVEEESSFPGGEEALYKYLRDNLTYPSRAREAGIEGTVRLTFVVEKNGSISNVRVKRSVATALDEEAVRVVKAMPKWNPGKQRGKAVRSQFELPIIFKLN